MFLFVYICLFVYITSARTPLHAVPSVHFMYSCRTFQLRSAYFFNTCKIIIFFAAVPLLYLDASSFIDGNFFYIHTVPIFLKPMYSVTFRIIIVLY